MKRILGRLLIGVPCAALALVVVGVIVTDRQLRAQAEEPGKAHAALARDALGPYLREQEAVAASPLFDANRSERDAGPFLNRALPWADAGAFKTPAPRELALPDEIRKQVSEWGPEWPVAGRGNPVTALDTRWMSRLHEYGFWELTTDSGLAELTGSEFASLPIPEFVTVQHWAKIRLLQGMDRGELAAACRDVRQLASLAYSTETLIGAMVAAALLQIEGRAVDAWVASGGQAEGLAPVPTAELDRFRRVIWAANAYANLATPAELARAALPGDRLVAGRCAALTERVLTAAILRDLGPGEYAPGLADLEKDLAHPPAGCRLATARLMWSRMNPVLPMRDLGDSEDAVLAEYGALGRAIRWLFPDYLRGHMRRSLIAITIPDRKHLEAMLPPQAQAAP